MEFVALMDKFLFLTNGDENYVCKLSWSDTDVTTTPTHKLELATPTDQSTASYTKIIPFWRKYISQED